MKAKIQATAAQLNIPNLVHFTRASNIPLIMQHGLQPVAAFEKLQIAPAINDELRLDGRLPGISTSVGLANDKMFYSLRQQNPGVEWAVLAISRKVLWEKDVLFCRHNAADARISKLGDNELRSHEAFLSMFSEIDGHPSRGDQKLKPFDPTDVQAEALVMEPIQVDFILGAAFEDASTKAKYEGLFKKTLLNGKGKGYFANRKYNREYGQ
ncbi:DarT ssDNA thymidine ADP-ribosyltransferase family protein [Brevundimonas sp. SORGH_AS_0993]|uniref:DarT ssDNA thymidine ADP-ribosyltransferase family protein n=1 Tax=Brevundimonas sp. SORGH_AS_0993 TaxID=3041794 RepID=UPI00278054EA|nr:DarT ssDNA thymidine ADP-ribosyltransferase family protein [Brevundimonas sp. SORGH_AS_0993]MDQ1155226.1 hypothetical protein [Brevundimonas sp. SORGH_AS_0993]